jgi:hypothetical protein
MDTDPLGQTFIFLGPPEENKAPGGAREQRGAKKYSQQPKERGLRDFKTAKTAK